MIELLAAASDGWALVRDGDEHWLVRPPYREQDRHRLTEAQVARAMVEEDFALVERDFDGWGELCRHLEDEVVMAATPERLERAGGAAERLLSRATVDQARRHLDEIRAAVGRSPSDRIKAALYALLKSEAVRSDAKLSEELVGLLREVDGIPGVRGQLGLSDKQRAWRVSDVATVEFEASAIRQRGSLIAA